MLRRILLCCSLITFLSACIPATSTLLPTLVSVPPTATPAPSATPTPTPSLQPSETTAPSLPESSPTPSELPSETPAPPVTPGPSPTPSATAVPQPSADSGVIQILSPGPLSKLVSPFKVHGYAVPGHDNKGELELYGEDGRLLVSQLLQLNTPYKWAFYYFEASFTLHSVGELARLSLSTQDEYGRITALNSVHLLLLREGPVILNPPGNLQERCQLEKPAAGQRLTGGVLSVSGKMRPYNNLPLTLELISQDGGSLGSVLVPIAPGAQDEYVPFQVNMIYQTPYSQGALLVVRQFDDRISGLMYLYSQQVFLNP
jgi:hypothetical protein